MNIGTSIKVALALSGKDRSWLADQMNVSVQHISNLIKQDHANTKTVEKVARAFEIKPSELLELGERELSEGGSNA